MTLTIRSAVPAEKAVLVGILALSALFLGSCVDVCRSCLDSDPDRPVPAEELHKITIISGNQQLPDEAINIYFDEVCGIDCSQIIRFDLPTAKAETLMQGIARYPLTTILQENQHTMLSAANLPRRWWLKREIVGAKGVMDDHNEGRLIRFLLEPKGSTTRVYLNSYSM